MHSPTGYWAHYTTRFKDEHGKPDGTAADTYPVIGHDGTEAIILDEDGAVVTVSAHLAELRKGGTDGNGDGTTWTVNLSVIAAPPEKE